MKLVIGGLLLVSAAVSQASTVFLGGDSALEDTVVISLVNQCQRPWRNSDSGPWYREGSAKVYTFTPDALPTNLGATGGVIALGAFGASSEWSASISDWYKEQYSHKFVVACTENRFYGFSSVSVSLSADDVPLRKGETPVDFFDASYQGYIGGVTREPDSLITSVFGASFIYENIPPDRFASMDIVFGVAVSPDLYRALQSSQDIAVPVGADDRLSIYQPSLSKVQYTSIVSSAFNSAKTDAAAMLSVPAGKLRVCRFAAKLGVQAASDEYFLNAYSGSDGAAGGALFAAEAADYGAGSGLDSYEVVESKRAYDVRKCLSGDGYAIGVLPVENLSDREPRFAKTKADRAFRFVKLNGVSPLDFAFVQLPESSRTVYKMTHPNITSGAYDFYYRAGQLSVGFYSWGEGIVSNGWYAAAFSHPLQPTPPAGTTNDELSGWSRGGYFLTPMHMSR